MELILKKGIGELLFGMKRETVTGAIGSPNRKYKDEDANEIWLYDSLKLALTFYEDEDFRLGYVVTSGAETDLLGNKIIGRKPAEVTAELPQKQFRSWETEWDEAIQNHFNEDNWLMLVCEYGEIIKVEMGAPLERDAFVWASKG